MNSAACRKTKILDSVAPLAHPDPDTRLARGTINSQICASKREFPSSETPPTGSAVPTPSRSCQVQVENGNSITLGRNVSLVLPQMEGETMDCRLVLLHRIAIMLMPEPRIERRIEQRPT